MKILNSGTYTLWLLTVFVWFPSNTQALTQAEIDAEVQKNLNTPIPCGCEKQDEEDLRSRISEANAVIQEYDSMIRNQTKNSKDMKYTQDGYDLVQTSALAALLNAKHPNATKYGGKRGVAGTEEDCESWVRPDVKACLAVVLRDHEEVHSKVCKETDKPFNPFVSWRRDQRLIETMEEEKRGYQKELQRINEELNKMPAFCALDKSTRWWLRKLERDKLFEKAAWEHLEMFFMWKPIF
jgi:hypothetical protein